MGSLCGGNTQTTTSQQSTTPTNLAGLQNIFGQVQNAAATPFTPYTGETTAPVNAQQQTGIAGVNAGANSAQPYYNTAAGYATTAGSPLTAAAIQGYIDPNVQNVVNSTQANFNESNGVQQQMVKGNAASVGALGGDRQAIAQSETARQQQLAQAPVIAGLYSDAYNKAVSAAQADRSAAGNAAGTFGSLGTAAQQAALQGAGAQINAGTLEQQTQQQADQAKQQQFMLQQAYPFQTAQFLSQYGTPAALAQGSSTSGTQTAPGPNWLAQLAGIGIAGAGVASKFGAKDGGRIGFADGGSPFNFINDVHGYVPTGGGAPSVSLPQTQLKFATPQQADMKPVTTALSGIGKGTFRSPFSSNGSGGWGATDTGTEGAGSLGGLYSHGGLVEAIHHIHKAIKHSRGGNVGGSPFTRFADGGAVQYPDADDNMFTASGSDEKIIRAKRNLRTRLNENEESRSNLWRGHGIEGAANQSTNISDDVRGRPRRLFTSGYADGGATFDDRFGGDSPFQITPATAPVDASPFRLAGPEAMDAWRKGVDQPNPAVLADAEAQPIAPGASPPASPMRAALPPQITGPQPDDGEPTNALAFDSTTKSPMTLAAPDTIAPAETPQSKSPFSISPKGSDALIAAGLGMMASRSPFALSALGEGGLHGLASYSAATAAEQAATDKKLTHDEAAQRILGQIAAQKETSRHNKATEEKEYAAKLVPRTDPNSGETDYLTFDPKTKQLTPAVVPGAPGGASPKFESTAPPVAERRKAPAASPQARDDSYYDYMTAHRPPGYADVVKAVADYEIDPNREASLQKGARDRLYRDVKMYDPTYDQTHFAEKSGVIQNFSRGPASQAVNSLNVSVAHLGTLQQLGDALENGNAPAINKIGNAIAVQLGRPAPTNFDAAKEIVGDEVVKAVVGGVNSQADREAIKHLILSQQSPAQLKGVIKTFTALLGGQLDGQRQRYQAGTGLNNFDQKYLAPETREALKTTSGGGLDPAIARMVYPSGIPKEAISGAASATTSAGKYEETKDIGGKKYGRIGKDWFAL